ncbi:MAG TPA: carbon storage regulator [Dehalococcoidia bacterium]|nr:carbon storage regulator [Dehalococcoidia bacterium]
MSRMDRKGRAGQPSSSPTKGLVLTRNAGESVVLNTASGRVRVRVLDHGRLAIEAPKDVLILREELMMNGGS